MIRHAPATTALMHADNAAAARARHHAEGSPRTPPTRAQYVRQ
jgi:hypothetical protein